jgi:hypothetical protein
VGFELSRETIARLKERAGNAERRSDVSDMEANSPGMEDMLASMPKSDDPAVREYLEGMNTPLAGMIGNMVTGDGSKAGGLFGALGSLLGGKQMFASMGGETFAMGPKRAPTKAPAPATEAEVAAAEAKLGFALPDGLRRFYLDVADGGVGPEDGLYSLKQLLAKWREMTDEPVGPRGQKWPSKLLPVHGDDWDLTCIDRETGALVYFDVEEVDYGGWKACFKQEEECLEAWLGKWLAKPSMAEKAARRAERPEPKMLTDEDFEAYAEDHPEWAEWQRRAEAFTMTAEERAAIGLPETGWEAKVFEGLDASKIGHPTPGYAERRRAKQQQPGGTDAAASDPNEEFAKRLAVYGMTAEQRREMGLGEANWRDALWEGFDFSAVTRPIPSWLQARARRQGWKG